MGGGCYVDVQRFFFFWGGGLEIINITVKRIILEETLGTIKTLSTSLSEVSSWETGTGHDLVSA